MCEIPSNSVASPVVEQKLSEWHLVRLYPTALDLTQLLSRSLEKRWLVAQTVKNLPTVWETWVQSLSWEDPLEERMVTHSSILAWRIPTDRGAWRATAHGATKSQTRLND